jgi:Periplasmic copper-binding protein (NosD)
MIFVTIISSVLCISNNYILSYAQTTENEFNTNVISKSFEKEGTLSISQISPCSIIIEIDFKLENNLNCYRDGIIVSGDGITIDLNGKTITGPGKTLDYIGIGLMGNNITIKGPGTIFNFHNGIGILDSNNLVINSINLQNNEIGIFSSNSSYIELSDSNIDQNNMGISASSNNNLFLRNNSITNNEMTGIILAKTNQSSIETNGIDGSNIGIYLDELSIQNKINSNNLFNIVDKNNANGLQVKYNSNQYYKNNCMISEPTGLCN